MHAVAVRGTFDDCQALVKAMFNDHAFRDRVSSVGRQLHQLGAHRRAGDVLLRCRRRARRAAPAGVVRRADRQFRRHLRRLCRQAHGPADRAAGHRLQRQRHPAARARRPASTRCATWSPRPRRRWTSRSPPTSSATCSRRRAAMRRLIRAKMASLDATAASISARSGDACGQTSRRHRPPAKPTSPHASGARNAACGYLVDPHTACAVVAAERSSAAAAHRSRACRPRIPAKFPDAMQAITGERPGLPERLARPDDRPGALHDASPTNLAAVKALVEALTRAGPRRAAG